MSHQPPQPPVDRRNFWIGIGLGLIPVIVLWAAIGLGSNGGGPAAVTGAILYGITVLAAIVCLIMARTRRLGYGLLTMVFVGPVIWSVGCILIVNSTA